MKISAITYSPNFVGAKNPKYIPLDDLLAFTVRKDNVVVPKSTDNIIKQIPKHIKLKSQIGKIGHKTIINTETK
jgi:hypothetical protein